MGSSEAIKKVGVKWPPPCSGGASEGYLCPQIFKMFSPSSLVLDDECSSSSKQNIQVWGKIPSCLLSKIQPGLVLPLLMSTQLITGISYYNALQYTLGGDTGEKQTKMAAKRQQSEHSLSYLSTDKKSDIVFFLRPSSLLRGGLKFFLEGGQIYIGGEMGPYPPNVAKNMQF